MTDRYVPPVSTCPVGGNGVGPASALRLDDGEAVGGGEPSETAVDVVGELPPPHAVMTSAKTAVTASATLTFPIRLSFIS
jgi:hypothetical protein